MDVEIDITEEDIDCIEFEDNDWGEGCAIKFDGLIFNLTYEQAEKLHKEMRPYFSEEDEG